MEMGIGRISKHKSSRRFGMGAARLACALAGVGFAFGAAAQQQAPPVATNLGTMVITPTVTGPTLGPTQTTVRRSALKLQTQTDFSSPPIRPLASPIAAPATRLRAQAQGQARPPARLPPQPLRIVAPTYPRAALAGAVRGRVKVAFTITANGATKDIHIVASEPAQTFDEATIQAVRQWRFQPATVNGMAVATAVTQTIIFNPPLQQRQAPVPPPPPVPAQTQGAAPPPPAAAQPRPVHVVAPQYPPQAYRHGIGGEVTVQFTVGTDGKPHHIKVISARPRRIFNRAAKQAVRQWRFQPPKTPTQVTQTIRFTPPG